MSKTSKLGPNNHLSSIIKNGPQFCLLLRFFVMSFSPCMSVRFSCGKFIHCDCLLRLQSSLVYLSLQMIGFRTKICSRYICRVNGSIKMINGFSQGSRCGMACRVWTSNCTNRVFCRVLPQSLFESVRQSQWHWLGYYLVPIRTFDVELD